MDSINKAAPSPGGVAPAPSDMSYGGGGIMPPTPEDYRRMWEEQSKQMKPQDYERESERNKRAARKQVFQEAVQKAVTADSRFVDAFHGSINLTDPPKQSKQTTRPRSKRKG